jgi:hypothetical protein
MNVSTNLEKKAGESMRTETMAADDDVIPTEGAAEMDRHFDNFNIAGFTYHDGVDVLDEL